jgi:outer membrane biosynthesis protein TonB
VTLKGTAKWVLLALAGLAVAIGVAIAAANLTSQQIGIASESVSAGNSLAPQLEVPPPHPPNGEPGEGGGNEETTTTVPTETTTTPAETAPPEEPEEAPSENPGDDHGGHGSDSDD